MAAEIHIDQLSLDYFSYLEPRSLKKSVVRSLFQREKENISIKVHIALDKISARFGPGDRVALLGKNGAGKSTLLKAIAGIYTPSSGRLSVKGSIYSILDISSGMSPDINGYENIILVGILKGKTRKEMIQKFGEIEEFTAIGDHLKLPIRTYSLGMKLRLAFGIVTSMQSEILIMDEVIGVGDRHFMNKAEKRLEYLLHQSQIVVLTSHSLEVVRKFCNKALVLHQGQNLFLGPLEAGIEFYSSIGDCGQADRK
ncbi:MAG: hypothetical protein ACD_17C00468G0002 [uncultured bacterium]|nr:MAG: hypothetical protein ACD_17C00468G0002 [uncultured bacterium]